MKAKPYHHLAICPCCEGQGVSSAWLGDVTEMAQEDPEFAESYFDGDYDRACETCNGTGRVHVLNDDAPEDTECDFENVLEAQRERQAAWRLRCAEDGIRHW